MKRKILVTGANGQLGNELRVLSKFYSEADFVFVDVAELDITNAKAVQDFFASHNFSACINCAAYTAVDKAESDSTIAYAVNVTGVENLANSCEKHNAVLVHISTDFVFNGSATLPYETDTTTDPLSVYGQTKADGEYRALTLNSKTYLIRTSWVYSSYGNNFVKTMIRLGKEKDALNVVSDQTGRPTYAADLAECIFKIVFAEKEIPFGIYHFANTGEVSWYQFAESIMQEYGLNCNVNPIPTSQYPTPAKRPAYSVLNLESSKTIPGLELQDWKKSLKKCIQLIKENMMLEKIDVKKIIAITREAGEKIMEIYDTDDFAVVDKSDKSPLTKADKAANEIIIKRLQESYPDIPIISEENKAIDYSTRKDWDWFWLVDPLDGTKEFIKKNGEFTVNIALIHNGKPVMGVVGVPAQNKMYYAVQGSGAFKIDEQHNEITLRINTPRADTIALIGSRSHPSPEFDAYLKDMESKYATVDFVPAGSSLKFCLVAEGKADVYPRLGPTMEWDTAAGHAVVLEAGARVKIFNAENDLSYNKENLLNPFFIVEKA